MLVMVLLQLLFIGHHGRRLRWMLLRQEVQEIRIGLMREHMTKVLEYQVVNDKNLKDARGEIRANIAAVLAGLDELRGPVKRHEQGET